jgi:hypothetical protein
MKGEQTNMQATAKREEVITGVDLSLKASGAKVLTSAFKFSKTIGSAVAAKEGLTGEAASDRAGEIQRTLRRVRLALASV